jgi:hypothetical protein
MGEGIGAVCGEERESGFFEALEYFCYRRFRNERQESISELQAGYG